MNKPILVGQYKIEPGKYRKIKDCIDTDMMIGNKVIKFLTQFEALQFARESFECYQFMTEMAEADLDDHEYDPTNCDGIRFSFPMGPKWENVIFVWMTPGDARDQE